MLRPTPKPSTEPDYHIGNLTATRFSTREREAPIYATEHTSLRPRLKLENDEIRPPHAFPCVMLQKGHENAGEEEARGAGRGGTGANCLMTMRTALSQGRAPFPAGEATTFPRLADSAANRPGSPFPSAREDAGRGEQRRRAPLSPRLRGERCYRAGGENRASSPLSRPRWSASCPSLSTSASLSPSSIKIAR
jgi:hypothetical protein